MLRPRKCDCIVGVELSTNHHAAESLSMKDWEAQLNSTGESGQLPISKAQEAPESCECGQALMHRVQYLRCRKSGLLQGEARSPVHLSLTQRLGMNAATNFQPIGNNPDSYSEFAAVGNVALTHDLGSIS